MSDFEPKDIIINLDRIVSSQFVDRRVNHIIFRFDGERDIIIDRAILIKWLRALEIVNE